MPRPVDQAPSVEYPSIQQIAATAVDRRAFLKGLSQALMATGLASVAGCIVEDNASEGDANSVDLGGVPGDAAVDSGPLGGLPDADVDTVEPDMGELGGAPMEPCWDGTPTQVFLPEAGFHYALTSREGYSFGFRLSLKVAASAQALPTEALLAAATAFLQAVYDQGGCEALTAEQNEALGYHLVGTSSDICEAAFELESCDEPPIAGGDASDFSCQSVTGVTLPAVDGEFSAYVSDQLVLYRLNLTVPAGIGDLSAEQIAAYEQASRRYIESLAADPDPCARLAAIDGAALLDALRAAVPDFYLCGVHLELRSCELALPGEAP